MKEIKPDEVIKAFSENEIQLRVYWAGKKDEDA